MNLNTANAFTVHAKRAKRTEKACLTDILVTLDFDLFIINALI